MMVTVVHEVALSVGQQQVRRGHCLVCWVILLISYIFLTGSGITSLCPANGSSMIYHDVLHR